MKAQLAVKKVEKTDSELKEYVLSEFAYEPSVKATDIGVVVRDGILTLNGYVTNYSEKWSALRAAKRVAGITAIADDIEVRLPNSINHSDADIAAAAVNQIKCSTTLPKEAIGITVSEGWVTLEGALEWWYQKDAAEDLMQSMSGVTGVSNQIALKPVLSATGVDASIRAAFERSALLDASKIQVETSGSLVTLRGKVRNYSERDEAERIAWAAPGAYEVDNQISVSWF